MLEFINRSSLFQKDVGIDKHYGEGTTGYMIISILAVNIRNYL
ncbi:MAG TPA: hypothetical protein VD884_21015 [Ohtaekwangia sp.]|nr:hypothetical protein [Ohtaekwangia sp.]